MFSLPATPQALPQYRASSTEAASALDETAADLRSTLSGLIALRSAQEGESASTEGASRKRARVEDGTADLWATVRGDHDSRR